MLGATLKLLSKAGITFAAALRTILRQDPDVIMVGEIRDPETAQNAIQAAEEEYLARAKERLAERRAAQQAFQSDGAASIGSIGGEGCAACK